ncbi:ABC transporter permease [Microbacterium rhizomatis]|uniref:ABC transporter permease n=1 Tax=Microbacterium rhizomatis TaxID=1631477 RepID=A0A5J5J032_9MICO|nr:ABC transporter permease [Microbacterium rhizomatis]KAA9105541.1 ABC transporter permease [Microbacterium rhizomatis]
MSDAAPEQSRLRSIVERVLVDPTLGVVVLLVVFAIFAAVALPVFYAGNNLFNLLGSSITVMILAIGVTVVLISGGIDLSVGAVMALCAGAAATAMRLGAPVFLAFITALVVGIAAGLLNGLLVTRVGLPDFIATLSTLGFASGVLYILTQGVPIIGYMTPEFRLVGGLQPILGPVTLPMVIALVLALLVGWLLRSTALGTRFFAVGSNAIAARQSGIPVRWLKTQAYIVSGTCAAIAGIILAGRNNNVPADLGTGYEIQAISAAIIGGASLMGGRGRVLGAVLGALTLALAINIINLVGVPSSYQKIVIGVILLLAVGANFVSDRVRAAVLRSRAARLSRTVA